MRLDESLILSNAATTGELLPLPHRRRCEFRSNTSSGVPSAVDLPQNALARDSSPAAARSAIVLPKPLADGLAVVVRPAAVRAAARPDCARSTSSASTRSSGMPRSASMRSSASACGTVRGKPSNKQPCAQSLSPSRSTTMPIDHVVGHQLAGVHVAGRFAAERCRRRSASRSISPVERWAIPR